MSSPAILSPVVTTGPNGVSDTAPGGILFNPLYFRRTLYDVFDQALAVCFSAHGDGDGSFSLACEDFGGTFDESFPAYAFLVFFLPGDHWISPQWLSERRRLRTNVPSSKPTFEAILEKKLYQDC